MSYSILVHDETVSNADQAALLHSLVRIAPRNTIVVRTVHGESIVMRHPHAAFSDDSVALVDGHVVVYTRDIRFVEAYDPHPDFDLSLT